MTIQQQWSRLFAPSQLLLTDVPGLLQPMDPDAIDCQTAMYCNHYPSWECKAYREGTLRRIAHTDFEVLTLLFQRQGELPNARTTQHAARIMLLMNVRHREVVIVACINLSKLVHAAHMTRDCHAPDRLLSALFFG